jgi:hypothetical protein
MSKARAARLADIKRQLAADLGHDTIEAVTGPARERLELGALLRLQHETVAARLVEGGAVGTDELIRLSEAIAVILPPPKWEPPVIRFIDNGSVENAALSERLQRSEKERYALLAENEQLKRRPSGEGSGGILHQQASPQPGASQAGSNVVPLKQPQPKPEFSDVYGMLAELNRPVSGYPPGCAHGPEYNLPIDPSDKRDYGPRR